MELILQQQLPHQQKAIDAIVDVFCGAYISAPTQFYTNPTFSLADTHIATNIKRLQSELPPEYHSNVPVSDSEYLNLDIKMETGTGKTYVYTKTMFELHKRYGFNKFIIAVPSLAIKAGTEQFLNEPYARRHFTDGCGYGTEIETLVLESPKNKKKGRSYFPSVVSEFVKGSCQNTKKIYVLLVNMQLLTNGKMLTRDDYDYGVEGFYRPFNAIASTKPIVIIDEPHRFSRDQKAFKVILDEIKPQSIIRFGATFPETTTGRGKNKITIKDYQNLLYDLNACASFNQGLIKGVAKEHFEPVSKKEEKVKITSIDSKEAVHFQYKKKDEATRSFTLKKGDSLSIISDAFEGITISVIDKTSVEFSNGIIKTSGEELDVDIYMTSYQEQMLRLALQRHFETEKENFCNRNYKIKTLALFFIDDITSYRSSDDGKKPYLLTMFEELLKEQIEKNISSLNEHDKEYRDYLEASLSDLSACHAGYFSQDNSDSDEDIAKEVDTILHGKTQLLSFKNEDGTLNTLRFLFSKWTLKEGWDNDLNNNLDDVVLKLFEKPGVFTDLVMRSDRDVVKSTGAEMNVIRETGVQYVIRKTIPYNVFLKRISSATNLPIKVLHTALTKYAQKHGTEFTAHINENTVAGFCAEFSAWKNDNLQGRFRYERSKAPLGATALTYADGTVRSEISQGRIGTKIVPGTPSGKYLYDSYAYDSPLEKDNIIADIDEVIVYGKIPRASIAIPTITGGMYSPDFMYVVKHKNGHKELNIIVETKDVENKTDLRGTEKAKIECAKVFFNMLTADGYTVHFRDQLGNKQMAQIISEVMRGEN